MLSVDLAQVFWLRSGMAQFPEAFAADVPDPAALLQLRIMYIMSNNKSALEKTSKSYDAVRLPQIGIPFRINPYPFPQ